MADSRDRGGPTSRRVFNVAPEGKTSIETHDEQNGQNEQYEAIPADFEQVIRSSSPDEIVFLTHILSLKTAALIHLGVIEEAGEERDLETARQVIETLIVLEKRTRDHLSFEERRLLEASIQELKKAYLDAQRS